MSSQSTFRHLLAGYAVLKNLWSRLNDYLMGGEPRRPVPVFASPREAGEYLDAHCKWIADPLRGAADFYTHPERLQYAMESANFARVHSDCDDWSAWAWLALSKIPDCRPQIVNIHDASGRIGHHVICVYQWRGEYGVIDPNGHRLLPDLTEATLCRTFTEIYQAEGYRYTIATHVDYPFEVNHA